MRKNVVEVLGENLRRRKEDSKTVTSHVSLKGETVNSVRQTVIRDPPVVSVFDVYLRRLAKCTGYVVSEEEFLGACVCGWYSCEGFEVKRLCHIFRVLSQHYAG